MSKVEQKAIGFIFARGGSKGLPGKNIKPLAGKPLIAHSIATALACPSLGSVIVSTDDPAIASIAKEHGAEIPFTRPSELATDTAPEWLAWRHGIEWVRAHRGPFGVFVSLPPTSPFRAVEDVEACVASLRADPATDVVITVREAERNPYFNMVKLDGSGYASLVVDSNQKVSRRQDAPAVFDITTVVYAARPDFVLNANSLFEGNVRTVLVPSERSLDIDTPYDFMLAKCIAKMRNDREGETK
jgi:CMP-N-acetylneuraminic acid synthetase